MPKVIFIHGLNSSSLSFSFISLSTGIPNTNVDYISQQRLEASISQVLKQIPKKEPVILVGHSLGGVIAMNIALLGVRDVQKICTISSPLGGSKAAVYARWVVSGLPVLTDITPGSDFILPLKKHAAPCPVLSIISTGGSLPTSTEPNDSVVTVASQSALPYAVKIKVKANHFEILMHERVADLVHEYVTS
jgi:pimeloyl-ACP methyl ester carboxylesterase